MTRISTRSATPASSARCRARSACGGERVMPTTLAPYLVAARSGKLPQPQPTSSTRSPSFSASLRATVSSFSSCAASSVSAPSAKKAQL